ncbi:protein phosphatase 1K, mitochondrial [Salvelinus fontinalis]|uniref:protein phosphatase 1K, mitochondrial n=1 Tax=Salvelinus fontinalis TaxID=8038 RepID=UPI00248649AD|nr:protein phosphatase 1K, mitochondrial [Salvelinus fontinalis]
MSSTMFINLVRCGRSPFGRQAACLPARSLQEASPLSPPASPLSPPASPSTVQVRWKCTARFVPDAIGRPTTWDSFGIWDNRIEEPILLSPSIRYGKPIPQVSLSRVGTASLLGHRRENEDRLQVVRLSDSILYLAVFDGHGGPHAAEYCHTYMEKYIREALQQEDDLEKALTRAFLEVDKALYTHLSYFGNASFLTAGTTATVAVLRDGVELVVASVGDSRALLCRKGRAKKLTIDHTPDRKDERQRIKLSGGFVTWNSLGQANVNGRLAMTRSIGDFHLKNTGVIALPETQRINLQHHQDTFLALTTDGINFIMNDQEICDVINQCHDPTEAANVIAQQALQYGSEDNSTIVVLPFGAWGKQESSLSGYSMSRNLASSGRWS